MSKVEGILFLVASNQFQIKQLDLFLDPVELA